jgi:hypothetical protein
MPGLEALLNGTQVTIETSLLPPVTIDVGETANGEPTFTTRILRPRVTVHNGSQVLFRSQPGGDPDAGIPWGKLLVMTGVVAILMWKL